MLQTALAAFAPEDIEDLEAAADLVGVNPDLRRRRLPAAGAPIGSAHAYVAAADGSGACPLGNSAYRPPRYVPDGTQIAFNLGLGCRVRLVTIASGGARTLPFEACEPVWRP